MHIEANRQAYRYNLFVESADKYKFNYRRVSYGQNTLGNTTGRLFVHRRMPKLAGSFGIIVLRIEDERLNALLPSALRACGRQPLDGDCAF